MREPLSPGLSPQSPAASPSARASFLRRRRTKHLVSAVAYSALLCAALLVWQSSGRLHGHQARLPPPDDGGIGAALQALGARHPYTRCTSGSMLVRGAQNWTDSEAVTAGLEGIANAGGAAGAQRFVEVLARDAPCW